MVNPFFYSDRAPRVGDSLDTNVVFGLLDVLQFLSEHQWTPLIMRMVSERKNKRRGGVKEGGGKRIGG